MSAWQSGSGLHHGGHASGYSSGQQTVPLKGLQSHNGGISVGVGAFGSAGGGMSRERWSSYGGGATSSGRGWGGGGDSLLSGGEKETMQNLNTRLSSYLGKVKSLEEANADLEYKIKEWYKKNAECSAGGPDCSNYFKQIQELQKQIIAASIDNAKTILQVDNARLALDDFKMKFENEQRLRVSVEADNNGLHKVLDELRMDKSSLGVQVESLTEELAALKKNHEEEMKGNQPAGGQLSVEINAAPGIDLLKVLNDMRAQYEFMADKNRKEAECKFNEACKDLNKEIDCGSDQMHSGRSEICDLKRSLQALEIELRAALATKKSLEETLAETEGRYCLQLSQLQIQISTVEEQLAAIRCETSNQCADYEDLLDIKTLLEKEIETYRRLMDQDGAAFPSSQSRSQLGSQSQSRGPQKTRKVQTIVQEVIDGKVISENVKETVVPM
ncbi:keratin, type I cytoskeletal 12-like [Lissotriton helveticus]